MENKEEISNKSKFGLKHEDAYSLNRHFKRIKTIKKTLTYIILSIVAVYSVFPIYYVVITSFSPLATLTEASLSSLVPIHSYFTLSNYYNLLFKEPFPTWLKNTLIFSLSATAIGVGLSITTGIAFSRFNVPGKKALLYMLLILSMFPFTVMVIPYYFMFAKLHLLDTYIGLIIPYSAGAIIFASWLIKNYVDNIPKDYEQAAMLDGYTRTGALFRVLTPIAKPAIMLTIVLAFMGPYTDFALANLFITSKGLYTMAIGMYLVSENTISIQYGVYSAFAVLMGIPIFILFFFFQKYIVSGFSLVTYR